MKRASKKASSSESVQRGAGSRRSVQKQAAASKCTDSAIAETVQPTIVVVKVQDFRAQMKTHLEGQSAVLLGSNYHCRGIVLPLRRGWRYPYEKPEERRARLSALFAAALAALE